MSAGHTQEVGFGTTLVGPRPYVDEPTSTVGHAWLTQAYGEFVRVSFVSAFDADAFAGGVALALLPLSTQRAVAGVEVELGFAWASFGLPMAARTVGDTWVYATPRIATWGDRLTPGVPFGLDVHVAHAISARAECALTWMDFEPNNRRVLYGLALAYQFGENSK
jgi:hypothetical protein